MKSLALAALLFAAVGLQAQIRPVDIKPLSAQTENIDVGSALIQPDEATPNGADTLPEAPIAKPPSSPCPAGYWKPCALLRGNVYMRDRFRLSEHDSSWTKAMSNPEVIFSTAAETTSFIADYKTTRYCIDHHRGKEANPLLGQSRAQELGVGVAILAMSTFATAKLKSKGYGPEAVGLQWAATVAHTLAASLNAMSCVN